MRITVLYVIMSACVVQSVSAQEPQTFQTVLGREGVVRIVRDERTRFVRELVEMTHVEPDVAKNFDDNIVDHVSTVQLAQPATPASAEGTLRIRFRFFLGNLTTYLLATTRAVKFDVSSLEKYLDTAARVGRCGEVPCQRGCVEHKPCDFKCNACSPQSG